MRRTVHAAAGTLAGTLAGGGEADGNGPMLACPNCRKRLAIRRTPHGPMHACGECGGRMVSTAALLKESASRGFIGRAWQLVREGKSETGRPCPVCTEPMRKVGVPVEAPPEASGGAGGRSVELDVCLPCASVWLDRGEPGEAPQTEAGAEDATGKGPDAYWKYIPAIILYPVECGVKAPSRKPWTTRATAALCVIVFVYSVATGPEFFERLGETWGFVPAQWLRFGGLTLVAAFFIHGGPLHLLGNLYFLLVFGDNVEDDLGRDRYAGLLLASSVVGYAAHGLLDANPELPLVGASAGISGVIAYYAIAFPRAKLGFLPLLIWIRIPAWGAFILWALVQALVASQQARGITNVSGLAHLGGAAVGLVAALLLRKRRRVAEAGS